jgi:protein gp37
MGELTSIQWCDGTTNPVMGCDGCELWEPPTKLDARRSCYAGLDHKRWNGKNKGFAPTFEQVTLFPGRMARDAAAEDLRGTIRAEKPWLNDMPRLWFVSDEGDALSKAVPFDYLSTEIIEVVSSANGRRHIWLWLTKQPKRLAKFARHVGEGRWPSNLWPGTTITEPRFVDRIDYLRAVGDETTTRFISVEPQLAPISLDGQLDGIGWVIQGGESGLVNQGKRSLVQFIQRRARPFDLAWARQLRDECSRAGVPYFLKQLGRVPMEDGKPVELTDPHGGEWDEWPDDLRLRAVPPPVRDAGEGASKFDPASGARTPEVVSGATIVARDKKAQASRRRDGSPGGLGLQQKQAKSGPDSMAGAGANPGAAIGERDEKPQASRSRKAAPDRLGDEHSQVKPPPDTMALVSNQLPPLHHNTIAASSDLDAAEEVAAEIVDSVDVSLPSSATKRDPGLVARVADEVRVILARTVVTGMEEVGALLLREFYGDNPVLYEQVNPQKHVSLNLLLAKCGSIDVPVRRTFLGSALRMAVLMRRLPGHARYFAQLPMSHRIEIMPLRDPERVEGMAATAIEKKLTVKKLRQAVNKEREKTKSTRGRKPDPRVLLEIRHCVKNLTGESGRLIFTKEDVEGLADKQFNELKQYVESLARRVGELQRLVK